jgi:hypothetical protein
VDLELDNATPGRGLAKAWFFRISMLLGVLTCFFAPIKTAMERHELSNGVEATIVRASEYLAAPTNWSNHKGRLYASYEVRVNAADGRTFVTALFLPKEVIKRLIQGGEAEIVFVRDRPKRHLLKGEPLPAYSWGWVVAGVFFMGVFIFSLRLK